MYARVSTYAGTADKLDDFLRSLQGNEDAVRQIDGFEGAYLLVDRSSGRALTITLWSSEDAARASTERANEIRNDAAGAAGMSIESVQVFEVPTQLSPTG